MTYFILSIDVHERVELYAETEGYLEAIQLQIDIINLRKRAGLPPMASWIIENEPAFKLRQWTY